MSGVALSRYAAFSFPYWKYIFKHDTSGLTLCQITNSDLQPATCKLHPPLKTHQPERFQNKNLKKTNLHGRNKLNNKEILRFYKEEKTKQ